MALAELVGCLMASGRTLCVVVATTVVTAVHRKRMTVEDERYCTEQVSGQACQEGDPAKSKFRPPNLS